MDTIVHKLKPMLQKEGIAYREERNSLFVVLPNEFGELEISDLDEGDDIIGLVGEQWHTHSDCIEGEQLTPQEKILNFLKDIFKGCYLLIKEHQQGKAPVRTIEYDLETYKKYLPEGTTYEVFN
jgi:hypothetical protein